MSAIHVRDLDDAVIAALKARAAKNRRSLQGEVKTILEEAARAGEKPGTRRKLSLVTVSVGAPSSYSRDEIYDDGEQR